MNRSHSSWMQELKSMVTNPVALCQQLELPAYVAEKAQQVVKQFPLRVTQSFLSRMKKGDIQDPLLRQVLPLSLEANSVSGFSKDPLKEMQHNPVPGLLHKYKSRVLLTITGGCAIHCRYCFRRHFPYTQNIPGRQLEKVVAYISNDKSITEVILSGGDPLIASDVYLKELLSQLENIKHVKTIRFHTRLPIVLPSRITVDLVDLLKQTRFKCVCVIHCNHPQEIDDAVQKALQQLMQGGVRILNQSVLLKGINDTVDVLSQLSYRLWECDVLPYYLHLLDKVEGAAHFEVEFKKARYLYHVLREKLPGYLVPLLVEEKPGALSKTPII